MKNGDDDGQPKKQLSFSDRYLIFWKEVALKMTDGSAGLGRVPESEGRDHPTGLMQHLDRDVRENGEDDKIR
jgi:hypothetical protein